MRLSRSERLKLELQMLTGVVTDDMSYLVYLLLKDGDYFKEDRLKDVTIKEEEKEKQERLKAMSFDDFFNSL